MFKEESEEEAPEVTNDKFDLVKDLFTSEKLTKHYNKLHLLRSDFKYLNLVGKDGGKFTQQF